MAVHQTSEQSIPALQMLLPTISEPRLELCLIAAQTSHLDSLLCKSNCKQRQVTLKGYTFAVENAKEKGCS